MDCNALTSYKKSENSEHLKYIYHRADLRLIIEDAKRKRAQVIFSTSFKIEDKSPFPGFQPSGKQPEQSIYSSPVW